MDWDAHLQLPERYCVEFCFHTYFDDIEKVYHWEDGLLFDEDNEQVELGSDEQDTQIQAFIDQTLWEMSLPSDPREIVIDDKYVVIFTLLEMRGLASWHYCSTTNIPEDGDWGDTVTPTPDVVKRALEELGNPFISFYPQWTDFTHIELE